jgi:hypothetical protein
MPNPCFKTIRFANDERRKEGRKERKKERVQKL